MWREAEETFRQSCREGDSAAMLSQLMRLEDSGVRRLVEAIGGPRAMVRFLVQRKHILHVGEASSLAAWLAEHLHEAEPMHLLDLTDTLEAAREAGRDVIVRRLEKHLKFLQPPDPTRWSRRFNTPAQQAFLDACERGDAEGVRAALEAEPSVVAAIDKWGRDGLTLLGGCAPEEEREPLVALLCEAGIDKTAGALCAAACRGAVDLVEAMLAQELPWRGLIDEDALHRAAAATRVNNVAVDKFIAVAERLLAAGADVNAVDRWGTTVWGAAAEPARSLLEELGAEPQERGSAHYDVNSGCSAFIAACIAGQSDAARPEEPDLNEAAAANDIARVRHLLDEIYQQTPRIRRRSCPERPLHMAALSGHVEVTHLLVGYGYSPAAPNAELTHGGYIGPPQSRERTPIQIAVERGHAPLVNVLMNNVDFFQGRRARRK